MIARALLSAVVAGLAIYLALCLHYGAWNHEVPNWTIVAAIPVGFAIGYAVNAATKRFLP